jgi:hypothetical protein
LKDKIRIAENVDNPLPDDVAGELEKGGGPLSLKPHQVRLLLDTQIALWSQAAPSPRKRGLSDEADAVFGGAISGWDIAIRASHGGNCTRIGRLLQSFQEAKSGASDRMATCRHVTQFGATIIVILRPHAGLPGDY